MGPLEQESSRPECRRDIKPGADRHKLNENYQNGEATWTQDSGVWILLGKATDPRDLQEPQETWVRSLGGEVPLE